MSYFDELYEENKQQDSAKRKSEVEDKIINIQEFFKKNKISKWHVVIVAFGDHLLKDEKLRYRDIKDSFTVEEMKDKNGLNFGEYEFCYEHMAIILSDIHHKYIDEVRSIVVAPISSTKRKNSVLIEKKFNTFLLNDSYILLDNIQHISLERIKIKETNRIFNKIFRPVAPVIIQNVKDTLNKMFDIC
jgi:mRNA-degrading endonuclease toxin of MazEF toxin-antitoxin module